MKFKVGARVRMLNEMRGDLTRSYSSATVTEPFLELLSDDATDPSP